MSFTWFNINAGYGNQLIRFSSDSGTNFTNISFPPGVSSYSDLDTYIKEKTVIKKPGKDDEYPITLATVRGRHAGKTLLRSRQHETSTSCQIRTMVQRATGIASSLQLASRTVKILPVGRQDPETGVYALRA